MHAPIVPCRCSLGLFLGEEHALCTAGSSGQFVGRNAINPQSDWFWQKRVQPRTHGSYVNGHVTTHFSWSWEVLGPDVV
jgi:hypothetical protein